MTASPVDIQRIAQRAGVDLPEERAQNLVPAIAAIDDAARLLAAIDYGDVEPAPRFRLRGREAK